MSEPVVPQVVILGSRAVARTLAAFVAAMGWPLTVWERDVGEHAWPAGTRTVARVFSEAPEPLPAHTFAVIARGHEGDPESVEALLRAGAERVFLVASARRAEGVLEQVARRLEDSALLARVSAPAGLDLGGQETAAIALSLVAEMQWRAAGGLGELRPLTELRAARLERSRTGQRDLACPGQRA
ncbi:XdhC family protein [Thiofaba sp. EF100]|uniref:XdhC family protein n=1 Tax=Thiofaba sp. EF100 TaxID=3121274 RepID=UPI003221C069